MEKTSPHSNLIDFWKEETQTYKWKNGLINTPPYSELESIVESLLSFFPKKDFDITNASKFENNFIALQLLTNDVRSIYVLAEYASYIEYLKQYPELELNTLSNKPKINYPEVRNRFFEIFINKILSLNDLNPSLKSSYTRNGNLTPLDSKIHFNGHSYLIECVKLYDRKKELISDLLSETVSFQKKFSEPFYHEELMGGFLQFKKQNITPEDKNAVIENFRKLLKRYFQAFRNSNSDTLHAHQKFSDDSIHIEIMPYHIFQIKENEIYESLNNGITFHHTILGQLQGMLRLNYKVKLSYNGLDELISEKVRNKKRQHRDSPITKKIIAVEIENSYGLNNFQNSLPAKPETFISKKVTGLIDDDTAIIVVLRSLEKTEQKIDWGFISNNNFDPKLKMILTKPKMKWL